MEIIIIFHYILQWIGNTLHFKTKQIPTYMLWNSQMTSNYLYIPSSPLFKTRPGQCALINIICCLSIRIFSYYLYKIREKNVPIVVECVQTVISQKIEIDWLISSDGFGQFFPTSSGQFWVLFFILLGSAKWPSLILPKFWVGFWSDPSLHIGRCISWSILSLPRLTICHKNVLGILNGRCVHQLYPLSKYLFVGTIHQYVIEFLLTISIVIALHLGIPPIISWHTLQK